MTARGLGRAVQRGGRARGGGRRSNVLVERARRRAHVGKVRMRERVRGRDALRRLEDEHAREQVEPAVVERRDEPRKRPRAEFGPASTKSGTAASAGHCSTVGVPSLAKI